MIDRLSPPLDALRAAIASGLAEDRADEDPTSALLSNNLLIEAAIVTREPIVVAGAAVAAIGFGDDSDCRIIATDGERAAAGTPLVAIHGPVRAILRAERTVLNLMARLAGIATLTRRYVDAIEPGSKTVILDTRKTTPGLRAIEKYAVRCGGAANHRMNLAEAVFVKDNHLAAAGGLDRLFAVGRPPGFLIIEVESPAGIGSALHYRPDRLLLDNMTDAEIAESIRIAAGRCELEVSGGVTLERIPSLSRLGVDFISIGALTHGAIAVDLSLEIRP